MQLRAFRPPDLEQACCPSAVTMLSLYYLAALPPPPPTVCVSVLGARSARERQSVGDQGPIRAFLQSESPDSDTLQPISSIAKSAFTAISAGLGGGGKGERES
jgi:hypothetical protein